MAFSHVEKAAPIAVFQLGYDCKADNNPKKINLGVGAYLTEEGKPWVLPVVKQVEEELAKNPNLSKEYLPSTGLPEFTKAATEFLLNDSVEKNGNIFADGCQSISGTGALWIASQALKHYYNKFEETHVYVSTETWGNQRDIFKRSGFKTIKNYRYWDDSNKKLNIQGLLTDLSNAENKSIVILHGCAHNPTGCDPSKEEWIQIAKLFKEKEFFPVFDIAYQGFASGDPDLDAWAVRYFVSEGFELFATQSFAKNFGLYNERIGNLAIVLKNSKDIENLKSQLSLIIRQNYSNPPSHGARIVSTILNSKELKNQWLQNLNVMSDRIKSMRKLLKAQLDNLSKSYLENNTWGHIITQIGMFSFTGLNKSQCLWLKNEKSIYLMVNGRINMCGVTKSNVEYLADSIHEAMTI